MPSDGEGDQKSCEQGHVESDGREVASMRGESQNSKICGADAHPIEAARQFKFGFFLTTAASKILAPLARGFSFAMRSVLNSGALNRVVEITSAGPPRDTHMLTSAECRQRAEQKLAEAERGHCDAL